MDRLLYGMPGGGGGGQLPLAGEPVDKLRFMMKAVLTHGLFALPLLLHAKLSDFRNSAGLLGDAAYVIAGSCVALALLLFYFKLDYLFLSYRLHLQRTANGPFTSPMSRSGFVLAKVASIGFIISWPVAYLTFGGELGPLPRAYVGLFCLGATLLVLRYLMYSYPEYLERRS
jgi:hypothetical protein